MTGTSSLSGTLRWMSPELIKSSDADGGTSTFASDVYALAMVFYEVRPPLNSRFGARTDCTRLCRCSQA